jgi:hypothetical protein
MFPPELQVRQFVAEVNGAHGFRWRVYRTASDEHLLFECVQNPNIRVARLISDLAPDARSALTPGSFPREPLIAVIRCPECGEPMEGVWAVPLDPEDSSPEPEPQMCGSCAHIWTAEWPGYSYRQEI